jgi:hypothetical protein
MMYKAAYALPSPSEASPGSGAEDGHERHGLSVLGANPDKYDPGEENCWSDPVTVKSQGNNRPVGGVSIRTGVGKDNNGTFRSPEVVWIAAVCPTATVPVGEVEASDLD